MVGPEMLEPVGYGAGGGFLGALLAWLGFKSRLDNIEHILENLVSEKECKARTEALSQRVDNASERFSRIDANLEIVRQMLVTAVTESRDRGPRTKP